MAVGSVGDVYPYLEIGRALQQRGHEVIVLANDYFAAAVQGAGMTAASIGDTVDQESLRSDPMAWHPRCGWRAWPRIDYLPSDDDGNPCVFSHFLGAL